MSELEPNKQAALILVGLYVSNNPVAAGDLPSVIQSTYATIVALGAAQPEPVKAEEYVGAVSVRKSINDDHLISMIDGKKYKTLRRHLSTHNLTPDQYRERYNLPASYPMVCKNYSQARSNLAKAMGLGSTTKATPTPAKKPKANGSKPKAASKPKATPAPAPEPAAAEA